MERTTNLADKSLKKILVPKCSRRANDGFIVLGADTTFPETCDHKEDVRTLAVTDLQIPNCYSDALVRHQKVCMMSR